MMKRVLVGLPAASAGASAADHGFYVGVGRASVDAHYGPDRSVAFPADAGLPKGIAARDLRPLGASAWRAVAGYRVVDWLAIEGRLRRFRRQRRTHGHHLRRRCSLSGARGGGCGFAVTVRAGDLPARPLRPVREGGRSALAWRRRVP